MSGTTKIEWCDRVWNPVTGCDKVSEGCRNCYAERIASRFWGERKFDQVQCHPDRLSEPGKWKKPQRIFVNSMSDLFHPDVLGAFMADVWDEMVSHPRHTFMVLTKRPDRLLEFAKWYGDEFKSQNIWIGVSVENQKAADERIPLLLQTPAAVRFVSVEPMLGEVDLGNFLCADYRHKLTLGNYLDWVICGGETGSGARPMHPDWARSLRDQCQAVGIPFFFKRLGGGSGRLLDCQEWNQFPEVE
jgi:protein gp37